MSVLEFDELAHEWDPRVMVMGDVHGDTQWMIKKIELAASLGISLILHLGDWGLWPGEPGKKYLLKVEAACEEFGVDLWVTAGNHDWWARLLLLWENPKRRNADGTLKPIQLTKHIAFLPRGYRFNIFDKSFLSFGGAASVDFEYRTPEKDWWVEELANQDEMDLAMAKGYVDIMLTHETPDVPYAVRAVEDMLTYNPQGFSPVALSYSKVSRLRLTAVFESVKPALLVHGHMHVMGAKRMRLPGADHDTVVQSLSQEYTSGNSEILDLTEALS